ncbi:unnamed protein product [Caenorhabditis nigoni]
MGVRIEDSVQKDDKLSQFGIRWGKILWTLAQIVPGPRIVLAAKNGHGPFIIGSQELLHTSGPIICRRFVWIFLAEFDTEETI